MNKIFKKESLNFFTLENIENYRSGVLLLESNFFHLLTFTFPKDMDEREREFEINEKLETLFEEYDSFYFLEKELSLETNKSAEKTLLILIEKDKIYTLLDNLKEKKISLLGIYPLFLVELFNKDNIEKTYVEIESEKYRIYHFLENKLINYQEIDFDRDELITNPTYLEENLNGESFIYPNQLEIQEFFPMLKVRSWNNYSLNLKDDLNFLPADYIKEINYKKNLKLAILTLSVVTIISTLLFFSLQFFIKKEQNRLNILEENYSNLHEKNLQLREKILNLESEIKDIKEKSRVREFKNIKLTQLLKAIYSCGDLEFSSIEYSDRLIILKGFSSSENEIYRFQNNILDYNFFKNFNHDFIKLNDKNYEFHIEIEVDNGTSKKI